MKTLKDVILDNCCGEDMLRKMIDIVGVDGFVESLKEFFEAKRPENNEWINATAVLDKNYFLHDGNEWYDTEGYPLKGSDGDSVFLIW